MKLEVNLTRYIIKPFLATIIMAVTSYFVYINIEQIYSPSISTIISIMIGIIVYIASIVFLKIFNEKELSMLPIGNKIYKNLKKIQIYQ